MLEEADLVDRFFLEHADQRVHGTINPARIAIKNLAEEFAALADREPIPKHLRARYKQVAGILAGLIVAVKEAEALTHQLLGEAVDQGSSPLLHPGLTEDLRKAVTSVGTALNAAESRARDLLRQVHPELGQGGREEGMVHAEARLSLMLDPGPGFQHYVLEDTDFNVLEVPLSRLQWAGKDEVLRSGPCFVPEVPRVLQAELAGHGRWLHDLLAMSCMRWEHLPMVRTIFVDFDLGTGVALPGAPEESQLRIGGLPLELQSIPYLAPENMQAALEEASRRVKQSGVVLISVSTLDGVPMPQLVLPIDEIARQKQRDVLFVTFPELEVFSDSRLDIATYPPRKELLAFLDENQIPWTPCAYFSNSGYLAGDTEWIYLDVPLEVDNPQYQKLAEYLETPEGTPRDPRVRFLCLPLAKALLLKPAPLDIGDDG